MFNSKLQDQINSVRRFNRFFTRRIGVLREGLLHSAYTLTESRIIFELAQTQNLTASDLCHQLGLDGGYLSRILNKLEQHKLIEKIRSNDDRRQRFINLTEQGKMAFALLDQRSIDEISEILGEISENDRTRLVEAMQTIEGILNKNFNYSEPFYLRHMEVGDLGWVIHQHGLLYSQEYQMDERFEGLVAQICSDFIMNYDAVKERCWIAEIQGKPVGSVFCVKKSDDIAQLRLLLVTPKARGLGLGKRLVGECVRFARRSGYKKMILWTQDILVEAIKIYENYGFKLIEEDSHHSWGRDFVGQNWELEL
ncbi:MAG: MarR family transcriptional regulator [Proteobacteria bacterium]|nr:MarR family transcriptional regulator [Pseudomonadota bacterium]